MKNKLKENIVKSIKFFYVFLVKKNFFAQKYDKI